MATIAATSVGGRALAGLRRAWQRVSMVFSRPAAYEVFLPRSSVDFARAVGDGTGSSVVMAPLLWICRAFPEAPVAVWKLREDGQADPVIGHPLARLIRRPNPFFSGDVLWMATILSWVVDGNAYWVKIRNGAGALAEIWWVPHWMMDPIAPADGSDYISAYAYRPTGAGPAYEVPVGDVVHFRFGLDPHDVRKGFSPLKSVLAEIYTDEEAARFTATLLRNMGVPGLVLSPADGSAAPADPADLQATKDYLRRAFSGEFRGEPLVFSAPTKIEQFGFSPEQMLLRDLRRIPEERVSAVLGVPAIVAGLGAGLDRSTFTNMAEAREMAYESNVIPTQRALAAELDHQLLPEFERDPEAFQTGFDLTRVRVLQADRLAQIQRATLAVNGGLWKVAEGRRETGQPTGPEDEIYLRPVNLRAVGGPADGGEDDAAGRAEAIQLVADLGLALQRLGLASSYGVITPDQAAALAGLNGNGDGGNGGA